MSLIDFIEKLQNKPRHTRIKIMWASVAFCMVIIFVFWLWSLNSLVTMSTQKAENKGEGELSKSWNQIKEDIPSLWQSLGAGVGNIINGNQDQTVNQASSSPIVNESKSPERPTSSPTVGLPIE